VNPWDGVMQWETMRLGMNTEKILHNHATKNYVVQTPGSDKQAAVLTCDVINEFGHSNTEISIPPGSLVLHGCKDTSLIDIISTGLHKKAKAPKSNSPQ
jgi:hypothetical protein